MCGVTGIIRTDQAPVSRELIQTMTAKLAHRGPDGLGVEVWNEVAIGHRRLAIIDLETGRQPMCNEDEQVWITYNGEIYNYLELKEILQKKGHKFSTRSDTEVIIHAFEEWGPDCVKKFRGMFAFGIVDLKNKLFFLARDHFGIKPLYYRLGKNYVAFASELVAVKNIDGRVPEGNLQAVDFFLRYQYIPTPHTIYKNIFKLPPAHYLIINRAGHIEGPVRYWDLEFKSQKNSNADEWVEQADHIIAESVKAHLVSDVPFGVFLSGGIDSTLVALKMSEHLGRDVNAFSIGFEEEEISELKFAKYAAQEMGINLYSEIVREFSLDILPNLVAHYGEPFGDSSILPTWHVARLARTQVPMVLSGDGGDEGFGGYDSYQWWMLFDPWKHFIRMAAGFHLRSAFNSLRRLVKYQNFNGVPHSLQQWQEMLLYCNHEIRLKLWKPDYHKFVEQPCKLFESASRQAQSFDRLAFSQYMDYQTYLPCDILTKVDVASMYHGLEVRTPLIDVNVAELLTRLPLGMRFRYGKNNTVKGKYMLKKLLGQKFGADFIHRKKQGFTIPQQKWFLPGNLGRKMLEDLTSDNNSILNQWFDMRFVQHLMESHGQGQNNSGLLWLLLVLSIWTNQNQHVVFSNDRLV